MDLLVRKRRATRASFTRSYNLLNQLLSVSDPDQESVKVKFNTLTRLSKDLRDLECEWYELINKDNGKCEDFDKEYAELEEYKEKFDEIEVRYNAFINKVMYEAHSGNAASCSSPTSRTKLRLPKIELKQFSGNVKDWLGFWSQFSRIHNDKEMPDEDKFQYLLQATVKGSRASEIVESFPPTADNYSKAIDSLKSRFCREKLLTEYYVRELLGLVVKNFTSSKNNLTTPQLYDKLESYLRALESIGMTSDKFAAMLFPLVESCIPEETLRVWLRSSTSSSQMQKETYSDKLTLLLSFLRSEVEGEERINMAKTGFQVSSKSPKSKCPKDYEEEEEVPTALNLLTGETQKRVLSCLFCDKTHESKECFRAQGMSLQEKKEVLRKKKGCFLCLRPGHRSHDCKTNLKCLVCGKKHSAIMCPDLPANKEDETDGEVLNGCVTPDNTSVVGTSQCVSNEILLQTLLVKLKSGSSQRVVRAIIDTGSQRSYILKQTAIEMNCQHVGSEALVQILFGGVTSKRQIHQCYQIMLQSVSDKFSCELKVLDQPSICGSIPRLKKESCLRELKDKNIIITDTGYGQPEIEILIGSDAAGKLFTGNMQKLDSGLTAMETRLGWVLMGTLSDEKKEESAAAMTTSLLTHSDALSNLWRLDVLGITDPVEQKSKREMEIAAYDHFKKTVSINDDGRYEVCLPWTENREYLKDNRDVAEKRLTLMTAKLVGANKFEEYNSILNEWVAEGVIEEISEEQGRSKGYFLLHRGVFKNGGTTRLRPVFDASSKKRGDLSLNDCLNKGPNLLELIPSVFVRFREKCIGVISDIRKAFLQISVNKVDRDYLKFLWWEDYSQRKIKIFRHCRVVFGVNCSPFILGAVINYHLGNCLVASSNMLDKLRTSFYVDNCVTSVSSEEELRAFVEVSSRVMADAKFDLRGWESTCTNENDDGGIAPVLGLLWNKKTDTLTCATKDWVIPDIPVTRRKILSICQQVFDPVGFTCPITLLPKILLQETWEQKISWDDEVRPEVQGKFMKWVQQLSCLADIEIPRQITFADNRNTYILHTFCDASKSAYAAAVFLSSCHNDEIVVQLLAAKARVAPLKQITIPRLELLSCCMGVRLAVTMKEILGLVDASQIFWTDSTTALSWIKSDETWGTFVQNRVKEISNYSRGEEWRHVPGRLNPADLPSRGCNAEELKESRWWEGPEWLKLREGEWPHAEFHMEAEEVNKERESEIVSTLNTAVESQWYLQYFSAYTKIVRMVAWMQRFVFNTRKEPHERRAGELTVNEIQSAEKNLVRLVQEEVFDEEKLSGLKSLITFRDAEGIWRVKTKVMERKDDENFRSPMVLPNKHRLVQLLILEEHRRLLHIGTHILLSHLRERFWILRGRRYIRSVLSKCVRCKRHEARHIEVPPGTLPEDRIKDTAVYEVTGVDLAGPLMLKGGQKAWIVIFTCAVYRAVHLELTSNLATTGFLLCLRRFVARRGRPKVIYSDNGTNFVGADNLLRNLDWKKIETESAVQRIQWKFNPPTAAWWGGWWERIIQVVKRMLRRVLGRASLNFEETVSLLCDCEAVINSRPLTYLPDKPDDLIPLTPAMFLQDNTCIGTPELDNLDSVNVTKRFQYLQLLRQDLRQRFRKEYLGQLIQKRKKSETVTLQEGDVVLIGTEGKRRIEWPLARVLQTYPGRDGVARVVRLQTTSGEVIRPIQRLYQLEVPTPVTDGLGTHFSPLTCGQPEVPIDNVVQEPLFTKSGRKVKVPVKLSL